jgi:hypothetical protein
MASLLSSSRVFFRGAMMLRIGKLCWVLCAGNHKSPIFDNMRAGLSD